MTKEDRELIFIDLCARLPYEVIIEVYQEEYHYKYDDVLDCYYLDNVKKFSIKPYLFPLSSMTDKQKEELFELCRFYIQEDWDGKKREVYAIEIGSREQQ